MKYRKGYLITETAEELAGALGLPKSIAQEWMLKSDLVAQIGHNVRTKKIKITHLAKESGTSRARITDIMKGRSSGISLDVLFRILYATGQRIEIKYLKAS